MRFRRARKLGMAEFGLPVLHVRDGGSHLDGLGIANEVLATVLRW